MEHSTVMQGDKLAFWKYEAREKQIKTINITQGMVDGSAAKPALRQDTGFWGLFNASVTQIW